MKRWIFPLCVLSVIVLSSFRPTPFFDRPQTPFTIPNVERSLPRLGRKQVKAAWLYTLKVYAGTKEWHQLGLMAKAALDDGITLNQLRHLATELHIEPIQRACTATQNIRALQSHLGLSKGELFRMALFIETELEQGRGSVGNYLSRRKTGLQRTIEYDPVTGGTFIHLKGRHDKEVGHGVKKIVTKAILYNIDEPKIVAHCTSLQSMSNEVEALRLMEGATGVVQLYAATEHTLKRDQKAYSIMCPLYRGGSLANALKKKFRFSLQQKMQIALDILTGLEELHHRKLVHRDLTPRNVLLDYVKKGRRKSRIIKAVISDLGRTLPVEKALAVKVQAAMEYTAPEGLVPERLEGTHYYATDVYALGCVLHQLFTGKKGPWIDRINIKNVTQPVAVREAKFVYDLQRYRKKRFAQLVKKSRRRLEIPMKDLFERLILKMIDPVPEKRGTASELRQKLEDILDTQRKRRESKYKTFPAFPPEPDYPPVPETAAKDDETHGTFTGERIPVGDATHSVKEDVASIQPEIKHDQEQQPVGNSESSSSDSSSSSSSSSSTKHEYHRHESHKPDNQASEVKPHEEKHVSQQPEAKKPDSHQEEAPFSIFPGLDRIPVGDATHSVKEGDESQQGVATKQPEIKHDQEQQPVRKVESSSSDSSSSSSSSSSTKHEHHRHDHHRHESHKPENQAPEVKPHEEKHVSKQPEAKKPDSHQEEAPFTILPGLDRIPIGDASHKDEGSQEAPQVAPQPEPKSPATQVSPQPHFVVRDDQPVPAEPDEDRLGRIMPQESERHKKVPDPTERFTVGEASRRSKQP